jgi:hypothetical protein
LKPAPALLLFVLAIAPGAASAADASDPEAVAVADQVMAALGGKAAWNALPGLRWTFGAEIRDTVRSSRRHSWNKHTGWHRVEGVDRAGDRYVIAHHLDSGEGRAWVAGNAIEGDSLAKLIQRGKALWVNDTYWMLMPYKLRDPGVILGMDEPRTIDGRLCDRLTLRFEGVGLTPGDRYWVDVERATRRVCGWEMLLQGQEPPPVRYTWERWESHDGLWFPTAHRQGDRNLFTRDIETVREFRDGEFTAP